MPPSRKLWIPASAVAPFVAACRLMQIDVPPELADLSPEPAAEPDEMGFVVVLEKRMSLPVDRLPGNLGNRIVVLQDDEKALRIWVALRFLPALEHEMAGLLIEPHFAEFMRPRSRSVAGVECYNETTGILLDPDTDDPQTAKLLAAFKGCSKWIQVRA